MDRGAWQATVRGVARVRHDLVTKPPPSSWKRWRLNQFEIVHNKQLDIKRGKSLGGYAYLGKVCIDPKKKKKCSLKNWSWILKDVCFCCCCKVASVMSDSVWPHRWQPTRLPHPWDSPGKNTGVGCHFLLQCIKVKSESDVAQSCLTLSDPMDCSLPGSSVHGSFQQEYWSGLPLPSLWKMANIG